MILFIFEGKKTEANLFKTLEYLYFPKNTKNERKICAFGYNIYEIYRLMKESDFPEDIVSVIRDKLSNQPDNPLTDLKDITDISEIYLFFDYDFQNKNLSLEEMNAQLEELFRFFNDDSENTKLYIHYPMMESIKCTNELPDKNFTNYIVKRADCSDFKNWVTQKFTFYKSSDFYEFPIDKKTDELRNTDRLDSKIRRNWQDLKQQNISKANFICTGQNNIPVNKSDVDQKIIFEKQLEKYVIPYDSVAILNAFPLFLFEYFREF